MTRKLCRIHALKSYCRKEATDCTDEQDGHVWERGGYAVCGRSYSYGTDFDMALTEMQGHGTVPASAGDRPDSRSPCGDHPATRRGHPFKPCLSVCSFLTLT